MTLPLLTFDDRAGGVKLDLNQLIVSRLLIQANSGGGKSHAVRYMIEQNFGKVQQIVIDPEGEFATLRERYPFLLVGRDADVPADSRSVKLLVRKLFELNLSAILDLSEFGLPQQRAYVHALTQAVNRLPRELWKDCLIYYDEGHRWAPEVGKSSGKELQPLKEEIATLQSAGRKRGFCGIIATQRLSKLDKDVAAECLNKLIGRTSNEDIKRAGDELGLSKLQGKELRSLEPGTFWTYGPAISIDPVMVRTGPISTHPPKRGAARAPSPAAPGAIKKVLAELADLPHEAEEEARSVADLQRKNADLERRIRQAEKGIATKTIEKPVVDQAAIVRAVKTETAPLRRALEAAMKFIINVSTQNFDIAGVDKAEIEKAVLAAVGRATEVLDRRLATRAASMEKLKASALQIANQLRAILDEEAVVVDVGVTKNEPFTVARPPAVREQKPPREPVVVGDLSMNGGKQKILDAIANLNALGVERPTIIQVALFNGVSHTTGTFKQNVRELVAMELIDREGGAVELTAQGRAIAAEPDTDRTDTPIAFWKEKLGASRAAVLQLIVDAYPKAITREALAGELGKSHTTGTFKQDLRDMRTYGLIEFGTGGTVRASDVLFPLGV